MFPYADDTQSFSPPVWVFVLIFFNVLFFIAAFSGGIGGYLEALFTYGAIPWRFFHPGETAPEISSIVEVSLEAIGESARTISPIATLFTSMFIHGGFMHVIGNMWFLWLFGDNVEDRMGKLIFPIFYIVCGLVAGLTHIVIYQDSTVPVVGASGAIAGVMGAYVYFFPRATIATLWGWFYYWTTIHIPATWYLVGWFILQLFGGFSGGDVSNVAFFAHIGGFAAGLILAFLLASLKLVSWYPDDRGYREIRRSVFQPKHRRKRKYTWSE